MKLLFDQNISPRLVDKLNDIFPASEHVHSIGFGSASDKEIWDYAFQNDLIVVTKDVDFSERIALEGFPPKVIWIRYGNCSTQAIEDILRKQSQKIFDLVQDPNLGILVIF